MKTILIELGWLTQTRHDEGGTANNIYNRNVYLICSISLCSVVRHDMMIAFFFINLFFYIY